ncbi:FAD-dependent oxidoreductase [Dactylosporangium matsuzakiense]|uniref:Salicylate hydroxylase n=1 Tax=Dactylosporangium matsuzakiense TaxID=53360 RepID=A0A9W6KKM4_9ACTN|nr:NAD(P)/FAD-dependent oxidoreductase [Dactylosporangium matsuzakiense]UWZ43310.1 FAD-dependent monooxygenase [Dactylosporangium matsuzakiense]GLL02580.1 salicylate hydroxylase [Dactylosporangium matsuzakiense]
MRSAVVVGAGIGGLAAAGALARSGWKVTLLERDDRLRPGRAALVLWPNGVRALRALGLAGGLEGISTPVPAAGIRRPDGTWLVQPGAVDLTGEIGSPPVVVHREDLHDAFIAALGEQVDVRGGIAVQSARVRRDRPAVGDGRVTFEADLVVAADGPDSAVRRRLAAASTFASGGFAAWRAVIPWYRAPEIPAGTELHGEVLGNGQRFAYASLGERGSAGGSTRGGMYWVATVPGALRPEPPTGQLALLRRWFAGWPAPIAQLLAATEADDLVQEPVGEVTPLPETFGVVAGAGGFALVGDAAHAMPHHLAQGASLALEDVATLQTVLAELAVPAALGEYSRIRKPRILRVLQQSRKAAAVLQVRGRLAASLARVHPRTLERAAAAATEWGGPTG